MRTLRRIAIGAILFCALALAALPVLIAEGSPTSLMARAA
jgi:hypothetical protein